MIVELDQRGFIALQKERCVYRKDVAAMAAPALLAVTRTLLNVLGGAELAVLMCLLSLTVASGRIARAISVPEFVSGIKSDGTNLVVCGTGLSQNSVRSAVKKLSDRGLIHLYKEVRNDGVDCATRIFEINFTVLDGSLAIKMRALRGQNADTPPSKIAGVYISNYVTNESVEGTTSSSILAAASPRETQAGGTPVPYVGKRRAAATSAPQSAAAAARVREVIQRSVERTQARATAAASATASSVTKEGMQALLDRLRSEGCTSTRLMVTVRELGYLKKRLKENPPDDLQSFLRYALTYWGILATQNHKAAAKADGPTVKKSLPASPHFHTLTYWYPYFLRAYQNHKAGQVVHANATDRDADIERVTRELQRARQDNAALRNRIQLAPRTPRPPARTSAEPRRAATAPDEFPEWK